MSESRTLIDVEAADPAKAPGSLSYRLAIGASVVSCVMALPVAVHAAPAVAFVPPSGVSHYRLAFVTSATRPATSTNIADYNAFVTAAAANNSTLPATTWKALASTQSVSAASNISCGAACDSGVPIFLIDGTTEVATSANALFAGAILNTISELETGTDAVSTLGFLAYVWTGSNPDGTAATGFELGRSRAVNGTANGLLGSMITLSDDPSANLHSLFAISGDITSNTNVPEPGSLALLGTAVLGALGMRRRRHAD